ncbi:hypothetical protein H8D64_01545 [PVC group bacterium]|nr:hypothetical protein [PVC group bacterium]
MRKFITARTVIVAIGVVLSIYGFFTVLNFVLEMGEYVKLPAHILVLGLILPHMLMLTGFGMITAGIIFSQRQKIIKLRMEAEEVE